jgi:hypothetical protein
MKLKHIKPNCTVLTFGDIEILFSYETPVVVVDRRYGRFNAYVTTAKHSVTTSRHVNAFLKEQDPKCKLSKDQEFFDKLLDTVVIL